MHTPVEEQGLRARRLQSRAQASFLKLPPQEAKALLVELEQAALKRGLTYLRDDGVLDPVRVFAVPVVITPQQLAYLHTTSMMLLAAHKRLPELYKRDPAVKHVLQLPPEEEEWLFAANRGAFLRQDPIFARLDALVDLASASWERDFVFVEPNLSGVGGLHLLPAAERVVSDIVLPKLNGPNLDLVRGHDIRELLFQDMVDHLQALGRPGRHVVLVEPQEKTPGPDEQEELAQHFNERYGVIVSHADPRDLEVKGDDVRFRGHVVDIIYRDYAVADLLPLEKQGVNLAPMRKLFRENRVVSSITAEIDQKSCFEVLTDPDIVEHHFGPDERDIFFRHVPWTRLVAPRKTTVFVRDAAGNLTIGDTDVDLPEYVVKHREDLVLKPNRSYGGYGVTVGSAVTESEWATAVDEAMKNPWKFVVQRRATVPVYDLPVMSDGVVNLEPFFTVMGIAPSRHGVAILGRAAQKAVVNVAQRGGIVPIVVGIG